MIKKGKVYSPRGGVWRAWIRLSCLGTKGRPDLAVIAEEFRRQKAELTAQFRHAAEIAKAAKGARKKRSSADPTFGPNSKAHRLQRVQDARAVLWRKTQHLDQASRMVAIGDHALRQGLDRPEALALARAAEKFDAAQEVQRHEKAMESLERYRGGTGAEVVRQVQDLLPGMEHMDMLAVPLGPFDCVALKPMDPSLPTGACAWAHGISKVNLSPKLEKQFLQQCRPVLGEDCESLPNTDTQPEPTKCFEAGVCLCKGVGPKLKAIGNGLDTHMRKIFNAKCEHRLSLVEGFVVLRLMGEPISDNVDEIMGQENAFPSVFFHVGMHYLTPFRPTLLKLEPASDDGEEPAQGGRLYVQAQAYSRAVSGFWYSLCPKILAFPKQILVIQCDSIHLAFLKTARHCKLV